MLSEWNDFQISCALEMDTGLCFNLPYDKIEYEGLTPSGTDFEVPWEVQKLNLVFKAALSLFSFSFRFQNYGYVYTTRLQDNCSVLRVKSSVKPSSEWRKNSCTFQG